MNARQLAILASVKDERIGRAVYVLMTASADDLRAARKTLPKWLTPAIDAALDARMEKQP